MTLSAAIRKYFNGESKDSKIKRFEELETVIGDCTSELDVAVKGLNSIISNVDNIKKAAKTVIGSEGVTVDTVGIALDNIRFSDNKLSEYMDGFTHSTKQSKNTLDKAVKEMAELIERNPNMAEILINVRHDENLEKSLEDILISYKDGRVGRKDVVLAYNVAVESRHTDRDLSIIFDKYLKD